MARKSRKSERVEPVLEAGRKGGGFLGFGLRESDRPGGGPPLPRRSKRRRKGFFFGGRRRKTGERKRRSRKGGEAQKSRRLLGRLFRYGLILALIMAAGMAAVVGYYFMKLPPTSEWALPARPANVRILASDGSLITNRGDTGGGNLTLDEMPPYLPEAVIAIEDRRFYHHFGIDPIGLLRAFYTDLRAGGVVQGGSTLTQQLAKNLFLTPARTFERKIQEVILAVWLESRLTKKQILELYLNRVYLGAGAYGVDAAAHRYFGKSARNLTLAEAAVIAGLLKAPQHYSPLVDPDAAEGRAQVVLAAMREQGYISDREASLAMSQAITPSRDLAGGSGRYVADWIMDALPHYIGAIDQDIVVDTTIDMRDQALADHAIADTLAQYGGKYNVGQGAFVALDPNGGVKAMVGGRDYTDSPFNRAIDAHRQPGSAFKPFVYLAALEDGLTPETVRVDQAVTIKGWSPENYSRKYLGPVTLETALALSLNTVSAQVTEEVGPKAVAATARRLGITSPLTATPSISLGTSEVTLLELAGAFTPFANGGIGVIPHVIKRITTVDGKVLYERAGDGPGRVVDPAHVGMMNAMLQDVVARGTGRAAAIPGWQVAGKTGTSQDFRDAWFVGYTADLVAGAWFGNDDGKPTRKASGSNLPAIAWQHFMSQALAGLAVADLPGNYRFRDPQNAVPTPGVPSPPVADAGTEGGAVLSDDPDWQFSDAPTGAEPPAAAPAPPAKKKGFFRRLFGG